MSSHTQKKYNNIGSLSFVSSAISLVLLTSTSVTHAIEEGEITQEKCAGVVKAGLNDCASVEHACAGLNTDDGYESDWLWLPKGTCNKISNAGILNDE